MHGKPDNEMVLFCFGIAGVFAFSSFLPLIDIALIDFSPYFAVAGGASIAGLTALPILIFVSKNRPSWEETSNLFVSGVALLFAFPACIGVGLSTILPSEIALTLSFIPFLNALFLATKNGNVFSRRFWIFILLGTLLIIFFILDGQESKGWLPIMVIILGGWFASYGYSISVNLVIKKESLWVVSWSFVIILPISLLTSWTFLPEFIFYLPVMSIVTIILLGIFSMYFGMISWFSGLRSGRVQSVQLTQLLFALIFISLIIEDNITSRNLVFALFLTCIFCLCHREKERILVLRREYNAK